LKKKNQSYLKQAETQSKEEIEKLLTEKAQLLKETKQLVEHQSSLEKEIDKLKKDILQYTEDKEKTDAKIKNLTKKCKKYNSKIENNKLQTLLTPIMNFEDSSESESIIAHCQNHEKTNELQFVLTRVIDNEQDMVQYKPVQITLKPPIPEFIGEEIFIHSPDVAVLLSKIILEVMKE